MIVVTGWARSGTSMLMQVLDAGGLEPIIGRFARIGMPGNRRGVFEYPIAARETFRRLAPFADERDRCVKLIHPYLQRYLGDGGRPSAVLVTERSVDAVVASRTLLFGNSPPPEELLKIRARTLDALAAAEIPFVEVSSDDLVDDPPAVVDRIVAFVQPFVSVDLDRAAMAAVAEPTDWHHR